MKKRYRTKRIRKTRKKMPDSDLSKKNEKVRAVEAPSVNEQEPAERERILNAEKKRQRKLCLDARARLTPKERFMKSRRISENLLKCIQSLPAIVPGATVLTYAAFDDEADPELCARELRGRGVRIAYPAIMPGRQMLAAAPLDEKAMKPDRFGIPTPDLERSETILPEEITAIIVPCVGFDRRGHRLGHGWGYYDRFLVRCPKAPRLLVAFAAQELPEIAVGPYDLPMDYLVTEDFAKSCKTI